MFSHNSDKPMSYKEFLKKYSKIKKEDEQVTIDTDNIIQAIENLINDFTNKNSNENSMLDILDAMAPSCGFIEKSVFGLYKKNYKYSFLQILKGEMDKATKNKFELSLASLDRYLLDQLASRISYSLYLPIDRFNKGEKAIPSGIRDISFHPTENLIAFLSKYNQLIICEQKENSIIHKTAFPGEKIVSIAFCQNQKNTIAIASLLEEGVIPWGDRTPLKGIIRLINYNDNSEIKKYKIDDIERKLQFGHLRGYHHNLSHSPLLVDPTGKHFCYLDSSFTVKIINTETSQESTCDLRYFFIEKRFGNFTQQDGISFFEFDSTGKILGIYGQGNYSRDMLKVCLYSIDKQEEWKFPEKRSYSTINALGHDQFVLESWYQGSILAACLRGGKTFVQLGNYIHAWNASDGLGVRPKDLFPPLLFGDGIVLYLDVDPTGNYLIASGKVVKIWDINTGECVFAIRDMYDSTTISKCIWQPKTDKLLEFVLISHDGQFVCFNIHKINNTYEHSVVMKSYSSTLTYKKIDLTAENINNGQHKPNHHSAAGPEPEHPKQSASSPNLQEPKNVPNQPEQKPTKPNNNNTSHWNVTYELEYKDLTFGERLGKGGYGEVFQGTWKQENNNIVAIKKLLNQHPSEEAAKEFIKEAKIMALLKCDYTVQLRGYCGSPHYCLVMEYMPKGSLYNVLHSSERLAWETRYKIIHNMAHGLAYLHSANILHRDLKSLNVLLDEQYKAKLCDFGLAKVKTETQITSSKRTVGTVAWMAPELFKPKAKCTKESDIYSLGLTFWEVASRKVPFEDARGNQALIQNWVEKGERDDMPDDCSPKLAKLITWCWDQNPTKRPLAFQVVDYLEKEITENTKTSENHNSGPKYQFYS